MEDIIISCSDTPWAILHLYAGKHWSMVDWSVGENDAIIYDIIIIIICLTYNSDLVGTYNWTYDIEH